MKTGYLHFEITRFLRDRSSLFFIAVLPAFLYVVLGAAQKEASDEVIGNGNVGFYIMVGMAAYGVATATTGIGGMAAVERAEGWARQLGLTPILDRQFVATKAALAALVAIVPIMLTFIIGSLTGAEAAGSTWVLSALVLFAGSVTWALYGLCFGLAFRSESAVSGAAGGLVILSFLGNVFVPLSGVLLTLSKFTPMYGYVALARYPLTGGDLPSESNGGVGSEDIWIPIVNLAVWTTVFAVLATFLVRRGRSRQ